MQTPPRDVPTERRPSPRPLLRRLIGDALRRTRQEQGRTLADVATAARVSMQYLSELERGRKDASSEILAAVCEGLGIDVSDLLADLSRSAVEARERMASVVRLESIRAGTSRQSRPDMPSGGGDVYCLAA